MAEEKYEKAKQRNQDDSRDSVRFDFSGCSSTGVSGMQKGSSIGSVDSCLARGPFHAQLMYFNFSGYPHDKLAKMPSGINDRGLHDKAKPRLQLRNYSQKALNENYGINNYGFIVDKQECYNVPAVTRHFQLKVEQDNNILDKRAQEQKEPSRSDLFLQLNNCLTSYSYSVLTNALVCGVGGVGKTELAKYYANEHYKKKDEEAKPYYELIAWFNGKQPMQAQLEEFAWRAFNDVYAGAEETELLKGVYSKLSKLNSWLLIIDDIDIEHKQEVYKYLPQAQKEHSDYKPGKRHHVLLTSRITDLYESEDEEYNSYKIAVGMYSEQESISYLYTRLGIKGDEQKLKIRPVLSKLASTLEHHPLALANAASYLQSKRRNEKKRIISRKKAKTIQELCSDYDKELTEELNSTEFSKQAKLIEEQEQVKDNKSLLVVYASLRKSIKELKRLSEDDKQPKQDKQIYQAAYKILPYFAYLEKSAIPPIIVKWLIEQYRETSSGIIPEDMELEDFSDEVLYVLTSLSLLNINETEETAQEKISIELHQIIQATLKVHFDELKKTTVDDLLKVFSKQAVYKRLQTTTKSLTPWLGHIATVLKHAKQFAITTESFTKSCLNLGAYYLFEQYDINASLNYLNQAEQSKHSLNSLNHQEKIDYQCQILAYLGYANLVKSDYPQAKQYLDEALALYNNQHTKALTNQEQAFAVVILGFYHKINNNQQAIKCLQQSLEFYNQQDYKEKCQAELAFIYNMLGDYYSSSRNKDYELAKFNYQRAQDIYKVSYCEQTNFQKCLNLLMVAVLEAGEDNYKQATEYAIQALSQARQIWGENHILTLFYNFCLIHFASHDDNLLFNKKLNELSELLKKYPGLLTKKRHDGWAAIHFAAFFGNLELLGELIKQGADINAENNNEETILHLASRALNPNIELVKYLLENKGIKQKLEAKNKNGWTAMHLAAFYGNLEILAELIKQGADINAKNNDEETILHLASRAQKSQI